MGTLVQDVRYALRTLAKSPAFALVAVLSLALGIGANTAIFSVVNALLLRPLPLAASQQLVSVQKVTSEGRGQTFSVSYPDYQFYRDHNEVFTGLLCWGEATMSLTAGGDAEQSFGMIVSGNYFDVLGVRPAQGRFFAPDEDATPEARPVAVLSYGTWQRLFGGDPAAVGKTVALNGHQFTIVGVAPQQFVSTVPLYAPDVWVPLMMQPQVVPGSDMLHARNAEWLHMEGRLRAGVTAAQAQTQLSMLALQVQAAHPEDKILPGGEERHAEFLGVQLAPVGALPADMRDSLVGFIGLLFAIVGLVLLIACANLSSLLLARALARRREIAVRLALGAGRARIMRQLLTESMLLCLVSGAAGALCALWLTDLLLLFAPAERLPFAPDFRPDWRVFAFTLLLSSVTGVLFGLAPALQASKQDLVSALKDDTGGRGFRRSRLRDLFVAGQIALALLLLVSAGLFTRALTRARTVFPGAQPEEVLTVTLDPHVLGYTGERTRVFYRQLTERVAALPGVERAGLAAGIPVGTGYPMTGFFINEQPTEVGFNPVSPTYFETMRIPVLRGRNFTDADRAGAPRVAIIDETLARRFFPDRDPVGQYIYADNAPPPKGHEPVQIVGVVRGGTGASIGWQPTYFVYTPFEQPLDDAAFSRLILHVRTHAAPADTFAAIRREVRALEPNLPLLSARSLNEAMSLTLLPQRLVATVAGLFGLLGLALAAVGIFGLVSYAVTQRTHEFGVRLALGAQARDVFRLVLRQGLRLALAGIAVGLCAAFVVTRFLTSLLYGVSAADPLTYTGVALLLLVVTLLASYLPARRATKVDPMVALRYE
jgi:predicted permease